MKTLNLVVGGLVLIGATAFAAPSHAATSYRTVINHASTACVGTLHADQDLLRNRTMSVGNVTVDSTSDVRCGGVATPMNNGYDGQVILYEASVRNNSAASIDVNCSLADGVDDGTIGISTKYPKTITLAPGELGWFDWDGTDTGGTAWNTGPKFVYPSLMCQLPTDVSIGYTAIYYQEDVGQ
jgi:hypothetical protein